MTICPKCGGIADWLGDRGYEDNDDIYSVYICADCSHAFEVFQPIDDDYDLDEYDEDDWYCPGCGASLTASGFCPCCDPSDPLPPDYDENTPSPSSDFGEIPF